MSVKLLFPAFVFHRDFLGKDADKEPTLMNAEYFDLLKREIDGMRKKDPVGRKISNAYTGWQSNDGCDQHPTFVKCIRSIKRLVRDELLPFMGLNKDAHRVDMHNSWANINDNGAWNRPHLHNGCFYSGVFYIHADGDEGDLTFIDTNHKIAGAFPGNNRMIESHQIQPKTGHLYIFPSGLMHMVEPNLTNKDRYSISFNLDVNCIDDKNSRIGWNDSNFEYDIDESGNLIL